MKDEKKKDFEEQSPTVKIKDDDLTERMDIDEYFKRTKPLGSTQRDIKTVIETKTGEDKTEKPKKSLTYPRKINLPPGSPLGKIVQETTDITQEQIRECIESQKGNKENSDKLGDILLKKKLITEEQLLDALSIQLNMPILNLDLEEFDSGLVSKIPINFAKKHALIPVKSVDDKIMVAIANAIDYQPMDDLRILLESDIKPVLAKRNSILDATNQMYSQDTTEDDQNLIDELDENKIDGINLDEPVDLLDSADEAPIIRLINSLLFSSVYHR